MPTGTRPDPIVLLPCATHSLTEHVLVDRRGFNPEWKCKKCRGLGHDG